MRVALITTVKDEAATASALVEAVAQQTRRPDEWIVVDGGSRDGTAELFASAAPCRLIRAEANIAGGRNIALAAATAPLIAVTDGGCRPAPDWLCRLVEPLEAGRTDIAIGSTAPAVRRPLHAAQWALLDQLVWPRGWPRKPAISSRSLAFRKEVWAECPYPEWLDHGEDTWVVGEWRRRGWRLERVPGAMVEWDLRASAGAFLVQHFRYMRGDGRARLHGRRHLLRFGFYAALAASLVWGATHPLAAAGVPGAWLLYVGANLPRLFPELRRRGVGFALRALGWMPLLLLGMDAAKMAGYLRGRLDSVPELPRP
jgi:glycosyltransferase involved in cell wall biosynthesis